MYIRRVYSQHGSLVVNVPKEICVALDLRAGSYVCYEPCDGTIDVLFGKMVSLKGRKNADENAKAVKHKSKRARAKVRVRRGKNVRTRRVDSKTRADTSDHGKA